MRVAFCAYGVDESILNRTEFYRQDFDILKSLGHEVLLVNKPWQLGKKFDVAFVWWWNYLWMWGPVAAALGIPIVVTGTFDVERFPTLSFIKRKLKSWGAGYSAANVFVSELEARSVPATVELKEGSVFYSPHVVDSNVYSPRSVAAAKPSRVILNVSWQRITNMQRKMVPELLRAFSVLWREQPDLRLVLAGPPEDGREVLQQLAQELGVTQSVDFPGEISTDVKVRMMRECALYCQVSRYEGFGVAIAEAMACGAPVLVSRSGAVPEVVGDCGTYVQDLSVDGIVQGLRACLSNLDELRVNANRGVERINRLFSVDRRRSDFRSILERVVPNSRQ